MRPGDVVTVALDRTVRVLKVAGFAERRGDGGSSAGALRGLSPPQPAKRNRATDASGQRDAGAGRPTKRERRAIDRLRDDDQD